jgi:hypothetical protein
MTASVTSYQGLVEAVLRHPCGLGVRLYWRPLRRRTETDCHVAVETNIMFGNHDAGGQPG